MKDNNGTKKIPVIFKIPALLLVLSLTAAVFRGIILFNYTDTVNGLYTNHTVGNIFFIVMIVLIAATVALYFPLKKNGAFSGTIKLTHGFTSRIMSAVCALMLAVVLVKNIITLTSGTFSILLAAEAVLCIPSVIYLLSNLTEKKDFPIRGVLALFPALYAAIHTIIIFIDTTTQINASQRSFTLLALVFIMMFFLTEAEFFIPLRSSENTDEATSKRCSKFVVVGLLAAELAIIVTAPGIVFSAVAAKNAGDVIYGITHLCLGVYSLTK